MLERAGTLAGYLSLDIYSTELLFPQRAGSVFAKELDSGLLSLATGQGLDKEGEVQRICDTQRTRVESVVDGIEAAAWRIGGTMYSCVMCALKKAVRPESTRLGDK